MRDETLDHLSNGTSAPHFHTIDEDPSRRLSLRAVLAGALTGIVTYMALSFLGLGIGASTIDPLQEGNPFSGLGTPSAIWMIVSTILSLLAAGYIAGRVSGSRTRSEGVIHGFLAWALTSLALFLLLTSTIANVVGGTARTLGQGAGAVGRIAGENAPQIADAVRENVPGSQIVTDLQQELGNVVTDPQAAATLVGQMDLPGVISRFNAEGGTALNVNDRNNIINLLVQQGGVSTEQATSTVDRLQQNLVEARGRAGELANRAEGQARETGDVVARNAARAGFGIFAAMLLGALSSSLGGFLGARSLLRKLPTTVNTAYDDRNTYNRAS